MKTDRPALIPVPYDQRWRDARMRVVPVLVFGVALGTIVLLWKDYVAAPTMVGQAEPVLANVSSYKAGVLAELSVTRFQQVKSGDLIGRVLVTDPRILSSSLAVINAEIEALRAGLKPVATQQRAAMDYDQLHLDWMKRRAELATAKVNLELAESEFHRMGELFKDQIVAQRIYDQAKAARDRWQQEVDGLTKVVEQGELNFKSLQLTNTMDLSKVTADPLQAEIAVQESKLHLTEAELSPITLRAPIDGVVSMVFHRAGEAVTAGQPVVAIATLNPVRIVGYLRPPILEEPRVGRKVEVRTRGLNRQIGFAEIKEVGTQLENIPATLLGPIKLASAELGLPVGISLPANFNIRPGELVDITLSSKPE